MSSEKENILTKIQTFKDLSDKSSTFGRVKTKTRNPDLITNNNDLLGFLLGIIAILVGSSKLKSVLGKLLLNIVGSYNERVRKLINKEFSKTPYGGLNVSQTCLASGLTINVRQIDKFNILKYAPPKHEGKFNKTLRATVEDEKVKQLSENITLEFKPNDSIIVKSDFNGTVYKLYKTQISSLMETNSDKIVEVIINKLFGLDSKNKSFDDNLLDKEKDEIITNMVKTEDNQISAEITVFDFNKIFEKARISTLGGLKFGRCSVSFVEPDNTALDELINTTVIGLTSEELGNKIGNVVESAIGTADDSIQDSINRDFIQIILLTLLENSFASPVYFFSQTLFRHINNPDCINMSTTTFKEEMLRNNELITCLTKEIKGVVYDFLLDEVKTELQPIISNVIKLLGRELAENYSQILKSLL